MRENISTLLAVKLSVQKNFFNMKIYCINYFVHEIFTIYGNSLILDYVCTHCMHA